MKKCFFITFIFGRFIEEDELSLSCAQNEDCHQKSLCYCVKVIVLLYAHYN